MRAADAGPIRWAVSADIPAMVKIAAQAPEAADWSEASYRDFLSSDGAMAWVYDHHGEIQAFLVGRQTTDEAEVLNLAVIPTARRQGIGQRLLRAAVQSCRERGVTQLFLEVRESNTAAIAFYESLGFSRTGCRPAYYRQPDEAAVLMQKKLTN